MANIGATAPTPPGGGGTFFNREFFADIGRMMGCLLAVALCLMPIPAHAQMSGVRVVAACGTPTPWPALSGASIAVASSAWLTVDTNYSLCVNGISGGGGLAANATIVSPLGHATVDTAAISIVPSATATFPISGSISNTTFAATQATAASLNATVVGTGTFATQDNLTGINSITPLVNVGATGTGSLRVTAAQDTTTIAGAAPGTAGSASANVVTVQGIASGTALPTSADPCSYVAKTNLAISGNGTALAQIVAASGSTKIYVCSLSLIAAGSTAYNLNTGTGSNCASSTAALMGSTTAANGMTFATGGGLTLGNGSGTVLVTAASSEICTLQSNAVYVSGSMTYVQQ